MRQFLIDLLIALLSVAFDHALQILRRKFGF